jgi:hypothetical protein
MLISYFVDTLCLTNSYMAHPSMFSAIMTGLEPISPKPSSCLQIYHTLTRKRWSLLCSVKTVDRMSSYERLTILLLSISVGLSLLLLLLRISHHHSLFPLESQRRTGGMLSALCVCYDLYSASMALLLFVAAQLKSARGSSSSS